MGQINKYYFDLAINFESDYDVTKLEKILELKPRLLVQLKDAKGPIKTAKFAYKTKEYDEIDTAGEFLKFLKRHGENLTKILPILKENKGKITFYIVFTEIQDKPVIYLDQDTIQFLAYLNASFEIDYA